MDLKKILLLCTLAFNINAEEYKVHVKKVLDGDTFQIEWPGLPKELSIISIRIKGIDTPEIHTRCDLEKQRGLHAKQELINLIQNNQVSIYNCEWDKFGGRWDCDVKTDKGDVASNFINNGLAIPYHGEKKVYNWCSK